MRLIDHTEHMVEPGHDFVIRQILKQGGTKATEKPPERNYQRQRTCTLHIISSDNQDRGGHADD